MKIKNDYLEILLCILILSVFFSKSIFNLFFGIIVIISMVRLIKNRVFYNEKIFYLYLCLIPLGIASNIFNSKFKNIGNFFESERSLLYVLVFMILNLSIKQFEKIKNFILIGGIVSALYSTISLFIPRIFGVKTLYAEYKRTNKMPSFQNGIRWARLLQILTVFSFINLEWVKRKIFKLMYVILSIFFVMNIVINGQRASILGAICSLTIFFLMYVFSLKKERIGYILTILLLTFSLGYSISLNNNMIKKRVVSIFDFNENISNIVRINFWKTGFDILKESNYIGIGSGNAPTEYKNFLQRQTKEYRKNYGKYPNEGKPFENNYINLAVENGIIYLIFYLFIQFLILKKIFLSYLTEKDKDRKIKLMSIFSVLIGDRIFMFFYPRTDSYVEVLIIFLMFYGIKLCEREEKNDINNNSSLQSIGNE